MSQDDGIAHEMNVALQGRLERDRIDRTPPGFVGEPNRSIFGRSAQMALR